MRGARVTAEEQRERRSRERAARASVRLFSSLEEENAFERRRRAASSIEARLAEAREIEDRSRGRGWEKRPIEKVWSCELVDWFEPAP
jgi:hypothetical protein